MYASFGAHVSPAPDPNTGERSVEFSVFFPGATQYVAAGGPRIAKLEVAVSGPKTPPDPPIVLELTPAPFPATNPIGTRYAASAPFGDGYYEYKYLVEFDNGEKRESSDPCARYGGQSNDNAAFVVGGSWPELIALDERKPLADLVVYELMIDDFAAKLAKAGLADETDAPLEAVRKQLDHIQKLGANAIAFMPWTAWPGNRFSWGYNPAFFFSVESLYMTSTAPGRELEKLALLRELINACHERGIHVIMDAVFNHADSENGRGFPYVHLYEQAFESPFIGSFSGGGFFTNLDFQNECTHRFVADVCRYWIDEFGIDGIRFDYTLGFWAPDDRGHGLNRLIFDVRQHLRNTNQKNFALILEHLSDDRYLAIDVVNQVGATGCWFDPTMHVAWRCLDNHRSTDGLGEIVDLEVLRVVDAGRDFGPGRGAVAYIENHDHSRIAHRAGGRAFWWRTQPYAIALFTGTGTPMIYNGQELGEEYDFPESGDERVKARALNWDRRNDTVATGLFALYQKLSAIRRGHPALRTRNIAPTHQDHWKRDLNPDGFGVSRSLNVLVFHRWGPDPDPSVAGEARYVVAINFAAADRTFTLRFPRTGKWKDLLSDWAFDATEGDARTLTVGSNWGHIFYWKPH